MSAFETRIQGLKTLGKKAGINAFLVVSEKNMRYLAGFSTLSMERFAGIVIPVATGTPVVIVPRLEKTKAEEKSAFNEIRSYSDSESPASLLNKVIKELKLEKATFGVEGTLPFKFCNMLTAKSLKTKAIDASPFFSQLRRIKSENELKLIEKAAGFVGDGIKAGIDFIKPGVTELAISCQIERTIKESGGESVPFCIVLSGANSALPHGETSNRKVGEKDIVLMDVGAVCEGYCGDLTRTVFVGGSTEKEKNIYDIVSNAHDEAVKSVKSGITAEEVDSAARNVIEKAGYSEYFTHRTGHGLGLDVHEEPYIVQGNRMELAPGMAFTIEPGIYFFGKFGVRIEDNVTVTRRNSKMLSNMSTERLII
ncbi:MAG: Xaa-Pro peptidase family protein [Candidatus Bathyarchaeia archaeon]